MPVLEANALTKTYRDGPLAVPVLRGVSLSLARGEVVMLEGPSGSGKTTLLCILGCILRPTSGHLSIEATAIDPQREQSLWKFRRRFLGFVFQQFNLFPSLTARENVEYALNLKGWRGRTARREADRSLDAVGMSDRGGFRPRELSGGQKQRVAIARALAGAAPILLADEPTGNLDSQAGDQILQLFRRLAKQENRAVMIVTHDPNVRTISDRVIAIRDGLLTSPGS